MTSGSSSASSSPMSTSISTSDRVLVRVDGGLLDAGSDEAARELASGKCVLFVPHTRKDSPRRTGRNHHGTAKTFNTATS